MTVRTAAPWSACSIMSSVSPREELKNSSAVKLPSVAAASFSDTAIRDCDWRSVSLWVFPKRTETFSAEGAAAELWLPALGAALDAGVLLVLLEPPHAVRDAVIARASPNANTFFMDILLLHFVSYKSTGR